jgi:hypothetical protein
LKIAVLPERMEKEVNRTKFEREGKEEDTFNKNRCTGPELRRTGKGTTNSNRSTLTRGINQENVTIFFEIAFGIEL